MIDFIKIGEIQIYKNYNDQLFSSALKDNPLYNKEKINNALTELITNKNNNKGFNS